jgi:1,2-diacylglycerol 3-alpha-glucosyltransferase
LFLPRIWRGLFSKKKFDIIHSHSYFGPGLDALFFSRLQSTPLIGTNHTYIEAFFHYIPIQSSLIEKTLIKFITWYYNRCHFVSTPSDFLLNDMKKKGLNRLMSTITNPIEPKFFKPRADKDYLKKELNLQNFSILYAGRLSSEKNPEILLLAFIEFSKKYPETDLIFVGQGALGDKLKKISKESVFSKNIHFMGPFMGDNKQKLYDIFHAADVFVIPSLSETQSMCTIQAMAASLPTIAARAGSLPELISLDRGRLFNPKNSIELCKILEEFYNKPEMRKKLGNNAKNFVKDFSVEKVADEWEKIYKKIIDENKKCKDKID